MRTLDLLDGAGISPVWFNIHGHTLETRQTNPPTDLSLDNDVGKYDFNPGWLPVMLLQLN